MRCNQKCKDHPVPKLEKMALRFQKSFCLGMPISLATNSFSSMLQVLHKLNFWKLTATALLVLLTHHRSTWSFSLIHHWKFQSLPRTPKEENLSCSCYWCFHLWPYLTAKYPMFHDLQGLTKLLWKITDLSTKFTCLQAPG